MKTLSFDLSISDEALAFANICRALNQNGVPYTFSNPNGVTADLTIGEGY